MPSRRSVIPVNALDEAFELYAELMPSMTDVRGEDVLFDLGGYTHLQTETRLHYIAWNRETLQDPEEIRCDHRRELPFREVYIKTLWSSDEGVGTSFLVYVDRRIGLNFWFMNPVSCPRWTLTST